MQADALPVSYDPPPLILQTFNSEVAIKEQVRHEMQHKTQKPIRQA